MNGKMGFGNKTKAAQYQLQEKAVYAAGGTHLVNP